jgi:hypothetical protein
LTELTFQVAIRTGPQGIEASDPTTTHDPSCFRPLLHDRA